MIITNFYVNIFLKKFISEYNYEKLQRTVYTVLITVSKKNLSASNYQFVTTNVKYFSVNL